MKFFTYLPGDQKGHQYMMPREQYKKTKQSFGEATVRWLQLTRHPVRDKKFLLDIISGGHTDWTEYEIDIGDMDNKDMFHFTISTVKRKELIKKLTYSVYMDIRDYAEVDDEWLDQAIDFYSEEQIQLYREIQHLDRLFEHGVDAGGKLLFFKAMHEVESRHEYVDIGKGDIDLFPIINIRTTGLYYPYIDKHVVLGHPALESASSLILKW